MLIIRKPHTFIAVVIHEIIRSSTMLLVLKPLSFILFSIRESIDSESFALAFYILTFVNITVLKNSLTFTVRFTMFQFAGINRTIFECIVANLYLRRKKPGYLIHKTTFSLCINSSRYCLYTE